MSKSVAIGLTSLYYAKLLSDPIVGSATYDEPVRLAGAITANFSPNASNDTLFADDGPYETASTLGAMTLELNVADIPSTDRALLLGQTYENGVLVAKSTDIPPYVAVGMSVLKSNGASRLIWYLKGKFTAPDDNNQTKTDSINWNTPTITGNFLKRDCDNQWRVSADTDDTSLDPTVVAGWFTTPNVLDMAGAARKTLTITKTGSGSILVNNIEYTTPVDLAEGAVIVLRFGATPTAFTVDAVDRIGEIENNVFAMAMPAADVAVAVTFA
jgi:phi13 family phage major tail protein